MRKMRNSGVEWIGEIPDDWSIMRLRYLCDIITGNKDTINNNPDGEFPFYVRSPIIERIDTYTFDGEAILTAGDGVGAGKVFHYIDGKFDFHQRVYCLHNFKKVDAKFMFYYLKENFYKEVESGSAKNTVDSIRLPMLLNYMIPIPTSIREQKKIAEYLDDKCAQIDCVIQAKEVTNEKLKEYRQSVIFEAVTRGLNEEVKTKDSGIEWIREIPEDWNIIKIKYASTLKGRIGWQGLKAEEFLEDGAYLITGTDFEKEKINWDTCVHISDERFYEATDIHVKEGDLLITKDGTVGKVAIAEKCPDRTSLNSGVLLIRPQKSELYLNKFLLYILMSDVFWKWFKMSQNGNSTIIHLYQEQFSNFIFPIPENIDEQIKIVDYLDKKCSEIDSVLLANENTIKKLKEYRQSVIYEIVTGKVEILDSLKTK